MVNWSSFLSKSGGKSREEAFYSRCSPLPRSLEGESDFSLPLVDYAFSSRARDVSPSFVEFSLRLNGDLSATDSWQWWMPIGGARAKPGHDSRRSRQVSTRLTARSSLHCSVRAWRDWPTVRLFLCNRNEFRCFWFRCWSKKHRWTWFFRVSNLVLFIRLFIRLVQPLFFEYD